MSTPKSDPFVPALIIVDFQEDFCPPNGSLPIPNGRDIAPVVNALLALPFVLKIATRDWHPLDHISFHTNHTLHADGTTSYTPDQPKAQDKQHQQQHPPPYTTTITISHPSDSTQTYQSLLWPVHCVADTHGAALVSTLDASLVSHTIDKGKNSHLEQYSAFYDPLRFEDSGIAALLKSHGVTDVFVVGLAADYCVADTAKSAAEEGFKTRIVEEGTRAVKPDEWKSCKNNLKQRNVDTVGVDGQEVRWVKEYKPSGVH